MKRVNRYVLLLILLLGSGYSFAQDIQSTLNHPERSLTNQQRDRYRHPQQTLEFFQVKPDSTVIEIWPGRGWYTEVLAPWIKQNKGRFIAAGFPKNTGPTWRQALQHDYETWLSESPERFDQVEVLEFGPPEQWRLGPDNSADTVLTFRNVHNWVKGGYADVIFQAMFDVLKPGGTLGVVDHRAAPGTDLESMNQSGYLTQALVIHLADNVGFVLEAQSEINRNAEDTKDHPKGVWTLPPTLRLGDQDQQKYIAIGESDRMTLRFRKPE